MILFHHLFEQLMVINRTEKNSRQSMLIGSKGIVYLINCMHVDMLLGEGGGPRVVVSTAAFHARVRGSVPGLGGLKETKMFLPHPRVKVSIVGNLRD